MIKYFIADSYSTITSTTRSQEAACIPILLLGRGISLGRGETMELFFFSMVFLHYSYLLSLLNVFSFFHFSFSECGIAQLRSKQVVE